MAPGFNPLPVFILFFIIITLYMVPSIIAYVLKHKHRSNISIINLMLGWTIIGWFACLIYTLACLWKADLCDEI